MKVNASAIRVGNVIEINGALYAVLTADNIKPGKGTPVTQIDARRISDGVKTSERFRTTEQVERAFIEEATYTYLFADDDNFTFMHPETFEQLAVPKDVIGDAAVYLADGMEVSIKSYEGRAVASELPARVTLEVVETEPAVKGQTASGSFKPAILSNGVRCMVPTHITPGARIVVMTADGSYVERAKD